VFHEGCNVQYVAYSMSKKGKEMPVYSVTNKDLGLGFTNLNLLINL